MASLFGAGSGKSRGSTGLSGPALNFVGKNVSPVGQNMQLQGDLIRQISEALRTGGIGAQIPIIQQAVSQGRQALSSTLRDTEGQLAASGLARTPFGARTLASTRLSGEQQLAGIPTSYAENMIGQAPQFSLGLLGNILQAIRRQSSAQGAYST